MKNLIAGIKRNFLGLSVVGIILGWAVYCFILGKNSIANGILLILSITIIGCIGCNYICNADEINEDI